MTPNGVNFLFFSFLSACMIAVVFTSGTQHYNKGGAVQQQAYICI